MNTCSGGSRGGALVASAQAYVACTALSPACTATRKNCLRMKNVTMTTFVLLVPSSDVVVIRK